MSSNSQPSLKIRSEDGRMFEASQEALKASQVFRDMFSCCLPDPSAADNGILELPESSAILTALLRLVDPPLSPPVQLPIDLEQLKYGRCPYVARYDPATIVPLPVLQLLLFLADKYLLDTTIMESLGSHLAVHAASDSLRVYGLATAYNMRSVASEASQYLSPMATYPSRDIKIIPTEAYHEVVQLQDFRVRTMKSILLKEDIFPHGYGACPSHQCETEERWDFLRRDLARKIHTLTDVAGEMEGIVKTVKACKICHKAAKAAVEMLSYKCRTIPRALLELESEE